MISTAQWQGRDTAHLITLQGHQLERETAVAFEKMQQAAASDGIDLQPVSSYRGFDRQLSIWNRKWLGELPLNTLDGEKLNHASLSPEDKMHAILLWSALPGASRHHWGTDMDVFDRASVEQNGSQFQLVSEEYQAGGPCYELSCWLDDHATEFGFYRPYAHYQGGVAPEAWHLSYHPVASKIIDLINLEELAALLAGKELQGRETVLNALPEIFQNYIMNVCDYG